MSAEPSLIRQVAKQLRGWALAADGQDNEVMSGPRLSDGHDPTYERAVRRCEQLGLARAGFVPDIARHIEIKQASSMRAGETRVIVIGKPPCGIDPVTRISCHRFLRHFLPDDATLIVYGPAGPPYEYRGRRTSP
jgi:hypothetical protein